MRFKHVGLKKFHFKLKFVHNEEGFDKFLCFDVTRRDSFDFLLTKSFEYGRGILIGMKSDLENDRQVDKETAREFAAKLGISYVEISSKEGRVDKPFVLFLKKLIKIRLFRHEEREREYLKNLKFDMKAVREKENIVVCNVM